jgi:hypothetical protein
MFGNGFSRWAIVNAHVLVATLDYKQVKLSSAARSLVDVSTYCDRDKYVTFSNDLNAAWCDPELAPCFFLLVEKAEGRETAAEFADILARIHDKAGVTIVVENSDDDPTCVEFSVHDPIANAWAEQHGSLDGGRWECADSHSFIHDSTYWRPGMFAELRKEGFRFDFSLYDKPDERDVKIAEHAANCAVCQGDWHKAESVWDDEVLVCSHAALT